MGDGTRWGWPAWVLGVGAAVMLLALVIRGATGTLLVLLAVALLAFGGVALVVRRGAFTPRR